MPTVGVKPTEPINRNKRTVPRFAISVIGLVIFVFAAWGASWYYAANFVLSSDTKLLTHEGARGVFGDQFGAVNALFSGLAFTGVIVTLLLQRREIKNQAASLQRQQFESGFFQLLALHSGLIDQLDIGGFKGRQAFEKFLKNMQIKSPQMDVFELLKPLTRTEIGGLSAAGILNDTLKAKLGNSSSTLVEKVLARADGHGLIAQYMDQDLSQHRGIIENAYLAAHVESKDALSHYFRTLYHILQYVDRSALIVEAEKERYAKLIGAQLSGLELVVLFYNSLVGTAKFGGQTLDFGFPAMLKLVKKYQLTKHLNANVLFHPIHLDVFKNLDVK